jgi:antitoxin (DNA-binding transcriptional repressor) of toxin-antitoxin stability system
MATETHRIRESDLAKELRSVLHRVEGGAEFIVERDEHPIAVIRPAVPFGRRISDCIALAAQHERETGQVPALEPDFADDLAEIVRSRKPREVAEWD